MKKIAFVGCSHFSAHDVPCQGKNNWTYQLYKKYPHHSYKNYSSGGRGIEYFQHALMDAKIWGADVVFINRTYCGRWVQLAEFTPNNSVYNFNVSYSEENWKEMSLSSDYIWGGIHNTHVKADKANLFPWTKTYLKVLDKFYKDHHSITETRRLYERKWYSTVTKVYNFENIFLIDWAEATHTSGSLVENADHLITSNVNDVPVVEWFIERYGASGETKGDKPLYTCGVTISAEDNHLTFNGNKELLEYYILANKNVTNALT